MSHAATDSIERSERPALSALAQSPCSPDFVSECGRVKLYLGDCEAMPRIEADALVSDPPYGHGYKSNGCAMVKKGGWKPTRGERPMDWNEKPFDPAPWLNYPTVILWGANHYASRLPDSPAWYVWDKRDGVGENNLADCELAWCNVGGSARLKRHLWMGLCRDSEIGEHLHPTQKPVIVMAWCMDKAKIPTGATVLDPYMGSGSTIIAAIRGGRKAIGIEKDPEHFKTAMERIKRELAQGDLFLANALDDR
jgi:site-specific DNA-methyltransferase (adenine-specific)